MLSTMKKRSLILKGVVQLRCLGLCRGNSLCMTCSGMFGAGARPRTRLLRRLHEKTSFGQDLQDYQDYKSPKTLAHCKNLVNPVNPVKKTHLGERSCNWLIRGRAKRKSNLPAHMEQSTCNRGDADKSRFRA